MEIRSPRTALEWNAYFEFRWQLLRAPLGQPRGSERDTFEQTAQHVFAIADDGEIVGVGRIHGCGPQQAQIRYVAARGDRQREGIGTAIIATLETLAADRGAHEILMNARAPVVAFYERLGYEDIGAGPTLYGSVEQRRMRKRLAGLTA